MNFKRYRNGFNYVDLPIFLGKNIFKKTSHSTTKICKFVVHILNNYIFSRWKNVIVTLFSFVDSMSMSQKHIFIIFFQVKKTARKFLKKLFITNVFKLSIRRDKIYYLPLDRPFLTSLIEFYGFLKFTRLNFTRLTKWINKNNYIWFIKLYYF